MGKTSQQHVENIKDDAKEAANAAKSSSWFDVLTRIGYASRGVLYGLIGWLAIQLIITGRGKLADREGALATISQQPLGKVFLIAIIVGLVGLALWGIVRAVADPLNKGHDLKGTATRLGYLITGFSYFALIFPAVRLLSGSSQPGSSEQAQQAAAGILTFPWGPWLVGTIGLVLAGVGTGRIYRAIQAKFDDRFKTYDISVEQRKIAVLAGRVGSSAQGVVLIVIGILALLAALTLDPQKVGGVDQALAFLSSQPFGPWLLGLVAAGLIAYALYSFMGAMWFRIKEL